MTCFPDEILSPPDENQLEITLFGPNYGESLVLHIPTIGWGVIDCCKFKIPGKNSPLNLPLEYLKGILSPKLPKLSFIILTHPHEDHYNGIDELITEYPGGVKRVCWYAGNGIPELKKYIAINRVAGKDVLPGYVNVLNTIEESPKRGVQLRRLSELTKIAETDLSSLIALSPSAYNEKKYIEKLLKSFPIAGKKVAQLKDNDLNIISVALFLKCGKFQAVFGSDLQNLDGPNGGWNAIVANHDCPELWANVVKVAHHGSSNGYNEGVWKEHCKKNKPIALIAPFNRKKYLPEKSVLTLLKQNIDEIYISSGPTLSTKLSKYYKKDVVTNIKYRTRNFRIIEPLDKVGFVRLRYLTDGTLVEKKVLPPAIKLP